MKRHVQQAGVRKYFGADLIDLQNEPLRVLDAFFAEYGPCIIQGCEVTAADDGKYDVAAGMVALEAEGTDSMRRVMAMPFAGATGVTMPLYLTPDRQTVSRVYGDGKSKPVAYDYKAVATVVKPADGTSYLEITAAGGLRFTDVMQDAAHRFITDAERTQWDGMQAAAEVHADRTAAAAEEQAVRDAVLGTRIAGFLPGDRGYFKTSEESLRFAGDRTIRVVFVTGDDVNTRQGIFRDGYDNQHNTVSVAGNLVTGSVGGTEYSTAAQPNTLYEVVLVKSAGGCKVSVNGAVQNKALADNAAETRFIEVGNSENVPFFGRIVSVDIFNFAFSDADIAASWNGGHPELWTVPEAWRDIRPCGWPSGSYVADANTWRGNLSGMTTANNQPAANGFSGRFQRFGKGSTGQVSIYNEWRLVNKTEDLLRFQLIEFEYRCDAPVRAVSGSTVYASFPANTGDARTASYIAPAGQYTSLVLEGSEGTYLEIRTMRIVSVGCLLELVPAGLTPTLWYDTSGQAHDVPYFPNEGKPVGAELSYVPDGLPATDGGNRSLLLQYAARYAADREAVLVRMADTHAGQELAAHAADSVLHVTDTERTQWNAKETPGGAQAKADAAEEQAVRDAVLRRLPTGAVMGKGLFNSSDAALTSDCKGKQHTTALLFVTPESVPASATSLYIEGADGTHGYGAYVQYGGHVILSFRGLTLQSETVPAGTLCLVVFSYFGDDKIISSVNGVTVVNDAPQFLYMHNPHRFILGGSENTSTSGRLAASRFVAARRFDFAMGEEQIALLYNGGHPELWRVPDSWRQVRPLGWPTGKWQPGSGTWVGNNGDMTHASDVPAANGFSGTFQRSVANSGSILSLFCSFQYSNGEAGYGMQRIRFEYRCDKPFTIDGVSYPANTGDAKEAVWVGEVSKYVVLYLQGAAPGSYIEIRTLEIAAVGAVLDLVPAGLTPTLWRDTSGQGNDVPYVPAGINPDEVVLSDSLAGFPATTADDREALIAYANYFTALREQLLLTEAAEAAARNDAVLRSYVDEVGNTALDAATDYADELAAGKENVIPTVEISNFDTFNPSENPITKALPIGGSCRFVSNMGMGQPEWMGSIVWAGTIVRVASGVFSLTAYNSYDDNLHPQYAVRKYINGVAGQWQNGCEFIVDENPKYVKFPSGLLIQWGKSTEPSGLPMYITFPMPFKAAPFSVSCTPICTGESFSSPTMWTLPIYELTAEKMAVRPTQLKAGTVSLDTCIFYWMAIGMAE